MMTIEHYTRKPTNKTPMVDFNPEKGELLMSGRSIPENVLSLFEPIIDWMNIYCQNPVERTVFEVKLEYFNTSSAKCILELLRLLEKVHGSATEVKVKWYYEPDDEDMMETGEDFSEIVRIPFELVKYIP